MKLKIKFNSIKFLGILPFLACFSIIFSAGLFILVPKTAEAACKAGFGSNTYECDVNTVQLTVTPSTFKIGDTVKFTITLKDTVNDSSFPYKPLADKRTYRLSAAGSGTLDPYISVFSNDVAANSNGVLEISQVITAPAFSKADRYTLRPTVTYGSFTDSAAGSSATYTLEGPSVVVTVAGASTTGPADVVVSIMSKGISSVDPEKVDATISAKYNPGASGKTAKEILFYCDFNGNEAVGFRTLSLSTPTFNCSYPTTAGSHRVFVKVMSNDASPTTIVSKELTVTVTGNEKNEGQQNVGTNNKIVDPIIVLLKQIINGILGIIQELIYAVFFYFVAPFIQAMLSIHPYTDAFVAVIYPGWIVVRNLCNMLFVVALIVIALATLFRVESYQFRHLLVQLIIAALLINFSLVIGQVVLGLADTVQAQFLPANVTVIRSLAGNLMVNNWRDALLNTGSPFDKSTSSNLADVIQPLFFLALSLGSFAVFCAIMVFLVIRIIALWILLLISPVAYACGVLPATASYRSQWWQAFIKYAFFTPIMAFFLNLTAVIANQYGSAGNPILRGLTDQTVANSLGDSGIASFVFKIASNIMLLIFLVAGLKVAEMAGVFGAAGVTKIAQGGIFAPFAAAGWGMQKAGGFAGRKWNEFTANKIRGENRKVSLPRAIGYAVLNPVAFAKGWSEVSEKKTHAAEEKAKMAGLEVVQQRFDSVQSFLKGGYKIKPHVLQLEKHHEDEEAKALQNLSRENVAQTAAEYFKLGDSEDDRAHKRGIIKLALSKGYIDDIVQEAHKTTEGRDMVEEMIRVGNLQEGLDYKLKARVKKDAHGKEMKEADGKTPVYEKDAAGNVIMDKAMEYNHSTRRAMYMAMFGVNSHGHLNDHAAMRLITEEGEKEGMDTGHLEYMTDMYFDNETGSYEFYKLVDGEEIEVEDHLGNKKKVMTKRSIGDSAMAGGEIAKRNSRTQAGIAWHSLMSSDGKVVYKDVLAKVVKAIAENPSFMQERTANMLVAGTTKEEDLEKIRQKFIETNNLEINDPYIIARLKLIKETDEKAFAAIISRFINDANVQAVERRIRSGFSINGEVQDLTLAKKLLGPEREKK